MTRRKARRLRIERNYMRRRRGRGRDPQRTIALLMRTINNLWRQQYPAALFTVFG